MKKINFCFIAVATALQLTAQQTANCSILLQPERRYIIDKVFEMNLEMDTGSNGNTAGKITMQVSAATTCTVTTGEKDKTALLPVKMDLAAHDVSVMTNEQPLPGSKGIVPPDMRFYGKYQKGQPFRLDSAGSMPLPDSIKTSMATIVDAEMNNFSFPDRPLRLGDSFTCRMPLLLPAVPLAPGAGVKIDITFTLMRITGNTASFDFTETIAADPKQDAATVGKPINITGTGSGKLDFDVKNAFFINMTSRLSIKYDILSGRSRIKNRGIFESREQAAIAL